MPQSNATVTDFLFVKTRFVFSVNYMPSEYHELLKQMRQTSQKHQLIITYIGPRQSALKSRLVKHRCEEAATDVLCFFN